MTPKTAFSAALQQCGLSRNEAAEFFDVRPDTVASWAAGRNPVRPFAWQMLRALDEKMNIAADAIVALIEHQGAPQIMRKPGEHGDCWPSDSVAAAMFARVALRLDGVEIIEPAKEEEPTPPPE